MFSLYPSFSLASYQTTNKLNEKYFLPLPYTSEKLATTYTNFYEFGSSKNIWRRASKLKVDNWSIKIDTLSSVMLVVVTFIIFTCTYLLNWIYAS